MSKAKIRKKGCDGKDQLKHPKTRVECPYRSFFPFHHRFEKICPARTITFYISVGDKDYTLEYSGRVHPPAILK